MSLDVSLKDPTAKYYGCTLYDANITHNLAEMAIEAGIYEALWRPYRLLDGYREMDYEKEREFEDSHKVFAHDIIPVIENGLNDLKARPDHFRKFDSPNGWGTYENFVPFVEEYLCAKRSYPDAIVETNI